MRGQVLKADSVEGLGLILGDDGVRYNFSQAQVRDNNRLVQGHVVDFVGMGDEAREGSRLPRTRARVAGRSGRHARSRGEVFMRGAAEGAAREPNGWFGDERDGDGCAGGCAQRARV